MLLPIDILQQIFLQLCPPDEPTHFPPERNEPRLVLAHVSSQWRAIAFAMPELWNNIVIDQPSMEDDPSSRHNLLPLWLSNSSSSILSFHFTRATLSQGYDCFPTLSRFIIPVIHRCSALTLELGDASFCQLLSLPSGSFVSLHAITVNVGLGFNTKRFIDHRHQFITVFHSSPNLHHVVLRFHAGPINIMHLNLPWHQLLSLTLGWCAIPADIFLDVLRKCTSLHSCHIVLSPVGHDVLQKIIPLSGDPVVSSSLYALNLRFSTMAHHSQLLAAISLPHLRKCELSCANGVSWPLTLQPFLQPLSCTLEDITLKDILDGHEWMDEILTLLPHLTRFNLYGDDDPPLATLRRLSDGIVAPRLRDLSLHFVNMGPLLDLLEGRLAAAARAADGSLAAFQTFSAHCDSPGGVDEAQRLAALRATGMTIMISSWDEVGNVLSI